MQILRLYLNAINKPRLIAYLLCLFVSVATMAQVNVTGTVVEKDNNEPLTGASAIVKGADGKIKKYAISKSDGSFTMSLPSVADCRLEVSIMGFAKKTIPLDSVSFPLTVRLELSTTLLKEVTVKPDRIKEQGDTITYLVSSFTQPQDGSIGDVLARMPGISVDGSGKIQYQGEDINKLYIEGLDMLGGQYGVAADGIKASNVSTVEVMENHQPVQVLSGITYSENAAINLKLKDKAKATWVFHGDAGGGYSWQPEGTIWDGELVSMVVMPNFQSISKFETNNKGSDLSSLATDFFATRRGTDLNRYVGVSLPDVPSLNQSRTLFNRSALLSTNALWKLRNGEFKAQIDYSFNRVATPATNKTTYFLSNGDLVVTENRDGVNRLHSLSGKFIYELNEKTAFINNTLKTNIDWDDVHLGVTGSLYNDQTASLPDYYVGNDFKLIKRFNGKHLVTFISKNEWESLPQTLSVSMQDGFMRQNVKDHAFYTNESAAYALYINGLTISLDGGIKGYWRSMSSEWSDTPQKPALSDKDDNLTNVINTDYFTVYAAPRFEYWLKRVNFTVNAPVSFAHYTFDKALANRNEVYFSPSLRVSWKPSNRFTLGVRGSAGRSPMDLSLIQPGYVMTNYRSFRRGVDDFYNSTSQSLSANLSYKHTRYGLFANAFALQSWSHNPYTMIQQLYGSYVIYSYSPAKNDGQMFMASGNIGKTLDFIRGSANVNGSFCRQESHLISQNSTVNSVGTSWSVGATINGTPLNWLSVEYSFSYASSRLAMDDTNASWLGNFEHELLLNFQLSKKWEFRATGEYYRNEITTDRFKDVVLLDAKLTYTINNRFDISAKLNNVFNYRTYSYTTYDQLSSSENQRWLRGRELLISISFKK